MISTQPAVVLALLGTLFAGTERQPARQRQVHVNEAVHAIQSRQPGALRRLLAEGLDPNVREGPGQPLVSVAVMNLSQDAVTDLIEAGADVNAADLRGMTPLMWAARSRSLPLVRILIRAGADPDARDRSGFQALAYASRAARGRRVHIPFADVSIKYGRMLPAWTDPVFTELRKQR